MSSNSIKQIQMTQELVRINLSIGVLAITEAVLVNVNDEIIVPYVKRLHGYSVQSSSRSSRSILLVTHRT
jgi:hypothetical protein